MTFIHYLSFILVFITNQVVVYSQPVDDEIEVSIGPFQYASPGCFIEGDSPSINEQPNLFMPYMVSLQENSSLQTGYYQHFCGGTMIANGVVLTAAHCIWDKTKHDKRLHDTPEGALNTDIWVAMSPICRHQRGERRLKVIKYHYFQEDDGSGVIGYDGFVFYGYDIAILELEQSTYEYTLVDFNSSNAFNPRQDQLILLGWGFTNAQEANDLQRFFSTVEQLQVLNLKHINNTQCNQSIAFDQFCAIFIEPNAENLYGDACVGDSGGPLFIDSSFSPLGFTAPIQVGVVSWGEDRTCSGSKKLPGVYTQVERYIEWIQKTLEKIQNGEPALYQDQDQNLNTSGGAYDQPSTPTPYDDIYDTQLPNLPPSPPPSTSPDNTTTNQNEEHEVPDSPNATPPPSQSAAMLEAQQQDVSDNSAPPSAPTLPPIPVNAQDYNNHNSNQRLSAIPCPVRRCIGSSSQCCELDPIENPVCSVFYGMRKYNYVGECEDGVYVWILDSLPLECYC
eukprot:TRINITY_DN1155_c1_g1_i2.p1 TRINITY_DN1155_c1_g1~~TRINITY_DN1155_c1_g1_i2.p1  ORF type:complete len:506 (-),score=35.00 TRINITY_DN1155_c1_g1_i2:260-1777(-)